jgi:hypothetical protein
MTSHPSVKLQTSNDLWRLVVAVKPTPDLLRGFDELEHHGERGPVREAYLRAARPHARLPEKHSPDKSVGMIGAITGLLSLLLALVLGTFAGSAYTLYATQKSELETLGARIMQLDSALEAYGPETLPGRDALRKAMRQTYVEIWGDSAGTTPDADIRSIFAGTKTLDQYLLSLSPKSDGQKQALSMANAAVSDINKTRLLMGLQLAGGIPWPMLTIVVCWSFLMFCGHGLVSPVNRTVMVALGFGPVTIASAIFMIVQLSDPYAGAFKLSAAPATDTIEALGSASDRPEPK